jgi:hypothetical protein
MKERTVPVPPDRPCAYSDDDELPVRELSYSGEPQRRGCNRRERSSFLNISYENVHDAEGLQA